MHITFSPFRFLDGGLMFWDEVYFCAGLMLLFIQMCVFSAYYNLTKRRGREPNKHVMNGLVFILPPWGQP